MNPQGREFGCQFESVEHPPESGWLHAEYAIGGTQPWLPQWAEEALILLGQRMFAALRPFQSPNQNSALLPLNIRPAQIAEFGNAETVIERDPDRSGIARSVAVSPCRLAQRQDFITAQMFTRSAFLIRHPKRPEPICSILSIWGRLTERQNGQGLPRLLRRVCSITA